MAHVAACPPPSCACALTELVRTRSEHWPGSPLAKKQASKRSPRQPPHPEDVCVPTPTAHELPEGPPDCTDCQLWCGNRLSSGRLPLLLCSMPSHMYTVLHTNMHAPPPKYDLLRTCHQLTDSRAPPPMPHPRCVVDASAGSVDGCCPIRASAASDRLQSVSARDASHYMLRSTRAWPRACRDILLPATGPGRDAARHWCTAFPRSARTRLRVRGRCRGQSLA